MSKFIIGSDRSQIPLFASSMDQAIAQDNEVRLIDLFVDSLKRADFGFDLPLLKTVGCVLSCGFKMLEVDSLNAINMPI